MIGEKTLKVINYLIAGLTLVSCILSISRNSIYQDGEWANAQWMGQDFITLLLAMPMLLISFVKGVKARKIKWILVYCGILLYYVYAYSFFMFAANLSILYLFHLPIFGLSLIGLVSAAFLAFNTPVRYTFNNKGLKFIIISYLLLISVMISFLWLSDIFSHLTNPDHLSDTPDGKAPLIIYSLDLAIIIPMMIVSAILLIRNKTMGFILTGIILTKASTMGFALMSMALSMFLHKLSPDTFLIILWSILGLIGAILTLLYLRSLKVMD